MDIQPNYPLSELTTFRIGGPALFFAEVISEVDLKQALEFAKSKSLPVLVIGGGSNILVSDEGFNGLVIHNQIKGLTIADSGLVTVGAGEKWDDVVVAAIAKNLAGIECMSGVPGSAGGAVVQNIGAYGQTLGDLVVNVHAVEVVTGQEKIFSPKDCQFEYRGSFFKNNPNKYIVTGFEIKLVPNGQATVAYPDVQKQFAEKPSLHGLREFIIRTRDSKGYLQMSGYEKFMTAGSFFKNPIVTTDQFEKLKPILGDAGLNRFWPNIDGMKISAAFLMQEAGFAKGYKQGQVGISPKHSLSLINTGSATAKEVKEFAEKIKQVVFAKFGIMLEEEVLYV